MENFAALLRQSRENKKLTLEDVEAATRIPRSYLLVLEGEAGLMSDHVYLMPFLRTYAKFLGLDITAVVSQFILELHEADSRSMPSSERRAAASSSARLSFWALPLLLALGILLVGSFLWQNGSSGVESLWPTVVAKNDALPEREKPAPTESSQEVSLATDLPTERPPTPSVPIAVAPPSTGLAPSTSEGTPSTAQADAAVPIQTDPAPVVAPPSQPTPPVGDGAGHRLNIQVSSPTWMRIVVDDQSPKEMILKAGELREWSAHQGFTLSFGNAGGVTLNLNGQTLPPLGKSGQVVRNIRLPADTSAPPVATTLQ
ncbi:MAG: helix-turn-helix domain-containing protein [Deltaproteobacteria bacterium]|nr:helix-turn-helix domain-containing protein [Deltaproteobacteria bacterium]